MIYMIKKPTIIITSPARTGTTFFYKLFDEITYNTICFHEPDRFGIKNVNAELKGKNTFQDRIWKIQNFGLLNLTLKKPLDKWGLLSLSHKRMSDEIKIEECSKKIEECRKKFIESFEENVYIESNYHYYGLIDVIEKVFKQHKLIYIMRDGRDWVRSHINIELFYHEKDLHTILNNRLTPKKIKDEKYIDRWDNMSQFEKLCWAWTKINSYALETIKKNKNAKMFYFEDIFKSKDKYENIVKILEFTKTLDDIQYNFEKISGIIEEKVHKNPSNKFPKWDDWSEKQKNQFEEICGPLMTKLRYFN